MGIEKFLDELNPAQKEAATTIDGAVLILAGAGTGKTKTITTRLAYLLAQGIDPASTLTLTFTNKAASEMRSRALAMISDDVNTPPALYTFHKFGLLFLRFHIDKLGRKNSFVVIDTDDKRRILKQFTPEDLNVKTVSSEISHCKNSLIPPKDALAQTDGLDEKLKKKLEKIAIIYEKYQNYLVANNLVDFDDLLALPHQILEENEELKRQISSKYQFIMVDEYQDTNELQLRLLKQLCTTHNNLCVVGDDDQSIYGWRGANVQNILNFEQLFDSTKIVTLEMNYRSTKEILDAANSLISHNKQRHDKKLVTTLGSGDAVELMSSFDENEESRKIATKIKKLIASGVKPSEIAVLFRINALSRSVEDGLRRENVPYELVDSVGFYERMEIKDAISYLRLIVNPYDDFSLVRVINKPKRGIGKVSLEKMQDAADAKGVPLFALLESLDLEEMTALLGKKSGALVHEFVEAIHELTTMRDSEFLVDRFEALIGLRKSFLNSDEIERVQNIDELYGLVRESAQKDITLVDFLADNALTGDQDAMGDSVVNLMTIHAAKGLEFEHVFVVGLEDGFFPLLGDNADGEEERRLGYVAFTRAKKSLTLSSVNSRFFRGKREQMQKSRFLSEAGLVGGGSFTISEGTAIKKGDLIKHKLFGMGRVTASTKSGKDYKLTINFGGITREILSNFVEKI